jgi:hypothetical protein
MPTRASQKPTKIKKTYRLSNDGEAAYRLKGCLQTERLKQIERLPAD